MGFMWLFWIGLIVLVVWLVVRVVSGGATRGDPQELPEQILKRRYARGEIDKEEYERRLSDLRR
jgi:putative membrane protein